MAHYQLANTLVFADISAQRQEIARAADLATRLPLPRQQKLIIEAQRLSFDGGWEDSDEVLKTAIREFPGKRNPGWTWAKIYTSKGNRKRVHRFSNS